MSSLAILLSFAGALLLGFLIGYVCGRDDRDYDN